MPELAEIPRKRPARAESTTWLVPGSSVWEVWEQQPGGRQELLAELPSEDDRTPRRITAVALPLKVVTCLLFWLETTDEKALPDLIRMQCERRGLIRDREVLRHRAIEIRDQRTLVQVLILQAQVPARLEVDGAPSYEVQARCREFPPASLCVWRELGKVCVALTSPEGEPVYFQALPHRDLGEECARELRSLLLLATAQGWISAIDECVVAGDAGSAPLGLPVRQVEGFPLRKPGLPIPLVPRSVRKRQGDARRQSRIRLAVISLAALYLLFLAGQIGWGIWRNAANQSLAARLAAIMPAVEEMQTTARQLDALNPAIDARTYPVEILYRLMALLPEKGVRLTQFEIEGNRLEIVGESSTAREAFDFMKAIRESPQADYIRWDEPPQPVPLPNDTTRFTIQGEIQGAYHDEET